MKAAMRMQNLSLDKTLTQQSHLKVLPSQPSPDELSPTSKLKRKFQSSQFESSLEPQLQIDKEISTYENLPDADKNQNVLKWWKSVSSSLPLLAAVAREVLAIPASSTKSERLFSCAGRVSTPSRHNLAPEKLEEIVIINKNESLLEIFEKN